METISIRLPDDLARRLRKEMQCCEQSRSELIRDALTYYLHERERQRVLAAFAREASELDLQEIETLASDFAAVEQEALDKAEDKS